MCSILTTHIQKENLLAFEWLGIHCCGSLGLAETRELSWARAMSEPMACTTVQGKQSRPHGASPWLGAHSPHPPVPTCLCSFPA